MPLPFTGSVLLSFIKKNFVSVVFGGDGDSSVRCCGGVGIFGSDIKTLQQRGDKRLILCVLLLSVLKLMAAVLKTLWPGF